MKRPEKSGVEEPATSYGGEAYLYEELSWPQIREAVTKGKVILVPTGATEDHGPHLPLNTDNVIVSSVCQQAAKEDAQHCLVTPLVPFGFDPHHMDFPGTISIDGEPYTSYLLSVTFSLAHHGFRRILLVNGHGSNRPFLEIVARKTVLETPALCGTVSWWDLAPKVIGELRQSERPGGMVHACELETSLMLHLRPELVRMDLAVKEIPYQTGFHWLDLGGAGASPLVMVEWWSQATKSGVWGDPTLATAEKGGRIFRATVSRLIELVREFKGRKVAPRVDHH